MNRPTLIAATVTCVALLAFLAVRKRRKATVSLPVMPVNGRVSQGFSDSHRAIDIAVPEGTEVACPWDGYVCKVWFDNKYGGGRSMQVKHTNGFTTGYAHLSGYHVGTGDQVLRGQYIALSGNTGSHTSGPHLHFTMRDSRGAKIDPSSIFSF